MASGYFDATRTALGDELLQLVNCSTPLQQVRLSPMSLYQQYKVALSNERLPLALLNLDHLDQNISNIIQKSRGMKIRVASKSVRSLEVLRYLEQGLGESFNGFMCFHGEEALWLLENDLDNLLIAYPYVRLQELSKLADYILQGRTVTFMVDSVEHLQALDEFGKKNGCVVPICLDIDLSIQFPLIYFGVYRSSLKNKNHVEDFLNELKKYPGLKLTGVMGYEAQVAGVTDNNPFQKLVNWPIRLLKRWSIPKIHKRRQEVVDTCQKFGHQLEFVNGGGTGSLSSTTEDKSCTEVTVGSGFYSPLLFDYYREFKFMPALSFALEVTRKPQTGTITCAGGGYVASGACGLDKIPQPYLPKGLLLEENEMCGEVQTPLHNKSGVSLEIGDPVFFRHSKAGELCERFDQIAFFRNQKIEKKVTTYRGDGKCFL